MANVQRLAEPDIGHFSGAALVILTRLADGPKHGYAIFQESESLDFPMSLSTVYAALKRLERLGHIEAEALVERRRRYRLTDAGVDHLRSRLASLNRSPRSRSFMAFNRALIADLRAHRGNATSGPFVGRRVLILSTTGAKSGEQRENPLAYTRSGKHYVIIASKGGAPIHPAWFHNLVANPLVKVEVNGETFAARARVAQEDEHDRLFRAQAAKMPAFNAYQQRTTRKIPVIVLERIG